MDKFLRNIDRISKKEHNTIADFKRVVSVTKTTL
jgi:hypothetical protein